MQFVLSAGLSSLDVIKYAGMAIVMFNWFIKKDSSVPERPKSLGQLGEEFAQKYYKQLGYEVLATNVFNRKGLRKGEIDFVAKNKTEVVFVEVKTRKSNGGKFGGAEESVNYFKQQKLLRAVKIYLLENSWARSIKPRIDVCVVLCRAGQGVKDSLSGAGVDKNFVCDKIITNAIEDWN